jgi:aryl-alcohol dehydrogenase-like predicted oxidoreductase/enamine deaminase RidA (YjgF/YER057c/UK114 family)
MVPTPERTELAPGLTISRVLTGLWEVADMEREGRTLDAEAAADAMAEHVRAGLTTFDMADHYGSAELIAGTYRVREGRPPAELLTKWVPDPGPITEASVRAAVERALERLRTDALDLLQVHAWSYADPAWLDCLFFLQELKDEGLIRHLGLTNFDTDHLGVVLASGIEVVSNQVSYSLLDSRARGAMTELCDRHGVKLLAFGTVAGGLLTERWLDQPEPSVADLDTWPRMKYKRFIEAAGGWGAFQNVLRAVDRSARRLGVSMANVACRAILERPAVAGVIVGARLGERHHIEDTLRLFDFQLDEESVADLEEALAGLRPIPGDCGDEYRKPPFLTAAGDLSHHIEELPAPYPVVEEPDGRTRCLSGTVWEDLAGFSRAVRKGRRILVSGTTATHGTRAIGGTDPAAQTHACIDKIEGALLSLGARLEDVVRTRIYIRHEEDWEAVSRAHGRRFAHVRPANTLVQVGLIGEGYRVEMEAEAVVD